MEEGIDARARILGRIRRGLKRGELPDSVGAGLLERLKDHPRNLVPARGRTPEAERVARFVAELEKEYGTVAHAASAAEIPGLIADHDVVLVPSAAEAFGLVAVEAIASGRWVVAADVGGLRSIVVDGVNGTLVPDGDYAGAIARVPDYDPFAIAPTVTRFGLDRWQAAMAAEWDSLAPSSSSAGARK